MESDEVSERVLAHIRAGRMVSAIKVLRRERGFDLRAAKKVVDELIAASKEERSPSPHGSHTDTHSAKAHTRRRGRRSAKVKRNAMPDYVVPRKPLLPQIIMFIVIAAFAYFLLTQVL